MTDGCGPATTETSDSSASHFSVHTPEFREGLRLQDFSRAILGVSDIARELSALFYGLKTRSPDSILTGHVRRFRSPCVASC